VSVKTSTDVFGTILILITYYKDLQVCLVLSHKPQHIYQH